MPTLLLALALSSAPVAGAAGDSDWTRFRGPTGTSVLPERRHPATWGPEQNVAWSAAVAGSGWSSPVVVGDRVFLSSAVDPEGELDPAGMMEGTRDPSTMGGAEAPDWELTFRLTCLDLDGGAELWAKDVGSCVPEYPVHKSNTFATESPASDGERVFVTFGALGELVAFDLEGEELWRAETGVFKTGNDFGWGISLVAFDGAVFLQNDNEEASFLAAFDAETGAERWRVDRPRGTSWGTPGVWRTPDRASLVASGPDTVVAYAPESGEEQWRVEGIGGSFSSSLTFDDERLYFGNSGPMSRGPLIAVPASAKGTLDLKSGEAAIAWRADRAGPGFASPVVHDGLVYVVASTNVLACHDAASGEVVYKERIPDAGTIVACPWIAGDELFILDEAGLTTVVRTGPEYEVLRQNTLPGLYWATPSVAGVALLLREAGTLYCVRD